MFIKIYCDGAGHDDFIRYASDPKIGGFTTNPSLCRKLGIKDYADFGKSLASLTAKPISFEVIADDFNEMERQAKIISSWGQQFYVKIPITNTKGDSSLPLIQRLTLQGIKINVTAVFTFSQISAAGKILNGTPAILSIFAGRIADTGVNPIPYFTRAKFSCNPNVQVLWASTRELFNVKQAINAGADIITIAPEMIRKLDLFGKDLTEYSLDTVRQFHDDAKASGFAL